MSSEEQNIKIQGDDDVKTENKAEKDAAKASETEKTDEAKKDTAAASDPKDPKEESRDEKSEEKDAGDGKSGEAEIHQLKKDLKKSEDQLKDLTDRYQRTLAEYQNFRNRTEKEKADLYGYAVKDVLTKILPVLDNLERGLAQIPEGNEDDAFVEGMKKLQKQFEKALDDIGVKPIEAVGKEFDPNLHNAVMHIDDDSVGENIVVQEFQKGYTYKGSVVRHSMVQVAN